MDSFLYTLYTKMSIISITTASRNRKRVTVYLCFYYLLVLCSISTKHKIIDFINDIICKHNIICSFNFAFLCAFGIMRPYFCYNSIC